MNIARLRRKLEHAGLKDFITTKFGEGYIIENGSAESRRQCEKKVREQDREAAG